MEKSLKLYTLNEGGVVVAFPSTDKQIEIGDFKYEAKRMGGAPTISATLWYPTCLDRLWNENVFAEFNGERYYIKSIPSSSYANDRSEYKHELSFVSERVILDNVYFYDAVSNNVVEDKPRSNSTKVVFSGKINDFIQRLNASLVYTGLQVVDEDGEYISGYRAIIDNDSEGHAITSEDKLLSFQDAFFSNVLQDIYNTYDLPYYFKGKEIHIGFEQEDSVPVETFQYGIDNALLSINKQNANFKIVNRATGKGSKDNIPFYYPNPSPKGELTTESSNEGTYVTIINPPAYSNAIELDDSIEYVSDYVKDFNDIIINNKKSIWRNEHDKWVYYELDYSIPYNSSFKFDCRISPIVNPIQATDFIVTDIRIQIERGGRTVYDFRKENEYGGELHCEFETFLGYGNCHFKISYHMIFRGMVTGGILNLSIKQGYAPHEWTYKGKQVELSDIGLRIDGHPRIGDTITQRLVKKVNTSDVLLPSIYRGTDGKQRFYNAVNDNYTEEGYYVDLGGATFPNPYNGHNPKEHIVEVSDIKPTIKGATYQGVPLDKFLEFAYDKDDNNETYEDDNGSTCFKHPYFFAKLPAMGFNLFDHAVENQQMVIALTSGVCGSCEFDIAVSEDDDEGRQYNLVQVDGQGNLLRDAETGRVICGVEGFQTPVRPQDEQNDTTDHPVWIALRKEENTFGILMPYAPKYENETIIEAGYRPNSVKDEEEDPTGKTEADAFVIIGINLPTQYVLLAEKKLEDEIIKYLTENNEEKFTFSINFSRIYFEEHPQVLAKINENSRLNIQYNGEVYTLYVSSFSYNMSQNDVLPSISVELDDELTIAQNALQNAISEVKSDVGKAIGAIDVIGLATPHFIRKNADDETAGIINFRKGIKFCEGGKVEMLDNNSAKLTIDYLEVTKKATFTSLEIQEKTHVGGQLLVTPAAINCGEVEELEDAYRCYFQTEGEKGDEIFNEFVEGDQAICQTFNAWGSRYYWRLVVGVGEDYIDLSKSVCDTESVAPLEGDKIIQFGNRNDTTRQNAIVLAAYGDGSPYFIQYQGIDDFDIPENKIVTKLSPYGNLITGSVRFEAGTTGIENIIGVNNLGGINLLRNTGFTGDYLSKQLGEESSLNEVEEMFSPRLDQWVAENVSVIELPEESQSGYGVEFQYEDGDVGVLEQEVYFNIEENEKYTLSFKAKGDDFILVFFGEDIKEVDINDTWGKYSIELKPINGKVFRLESNFAQVCEIQLEKGTVSSAWKKSVADNSSELEYWQSTQTLNGAIKDATTTINGGLVLTNTIMVGNYDSDTKEMEQVTGGMCGLYNDDTDIAFWAGGDYWAAQYASQYYKELPAQKPTEEQLAQMAKFVVTHGGKAILNDIVLRGTVYAEAGGFGPFFIGNIEEGGDPTREKLYAECTFERNTEKHEISLQPDQIRMVARSLPEEDIVEAVTINPYWYGEYYDLEGTIHVYSRPNYNSFYSEQGNIRLAHGGISIISPNSEEDERRNGMSPNVSLSIERGICEGIRHKVLILQETSYHLTPLDRTIICDNDTGYFDLYMPTGNEREIGQEYLIIKQGECTLRLTTQGGKFVTNAGSVSILVINDTQKGSFTIIYNGNNKWYIANWNIV